jgi:hypothetical protein
MTRPHLSLHGPVADRLVAIAGQLEGIDDVGRLAYRWPQIAYHLDRVAYRAAMIRRRSGPIPGLEEALASLKSTLEQSPAFSDPAAEALRAEAERLIGRIRG